MNKNKLLIVENQYFPCINWFKNLNEFSHINLYTSERWKKMSFRNRCVVAGSNGLISLSAPLQNGRDQKLLFKDVKIDYSTPWQVQHWRTIVSCYNKSPFFEFYEDGLRQFFERKYVFLFDLNKDIICHLNKYLFKNQFIEDSELDDFIEQKATMQYCSPKDFQQVPNAVKYHQLFEDRIGFQPNLSILDLLFMEGSNVCKLISKNE
ncbi:MAG TPA: WbqC family protein [Arachidicoccus sp.]